MSLELNWYTKDKILVHDSYLYYTIIKIKLYIEAVVAQGHKDVCSRLHVCVSVMLLWLPLGGTGKNRNWSVFAHGWYKTEKLLHLSILHLSME